MVSDLSVLYVQVMDTHLKDHEWLAGDQYTIADIANFTWVYIHTWSGEQSCCLGGSDCSTFSASLSATT